jgi:hypothetical protein
MNGRPLTDIEITRALRDHVPDRAPSGLRASVSASVAGTTQQRPRRLFPVGRTAGDPRVRRLDMLLAALLLVLTLAAAAGVGAWLRQQAREREPLPLEPPADIDRYVATADAGLLELPALSITIIEDPGPKEHYSYNGDGVLRHDHYPAQGASQPSEFRIFSRDEMAEQTNVNGTAVWLKHGGQGNPLRELAFATGLQTFCERPWEYAGLEYVIGRATHHVSCGTSEMWLDVATRLPLRSTSSGRTLHVSDLEIGPQPAALFEPPSGLVAMTDAEYACAVDAACEEPSSPVPPTPVTTVAPAPSGAADLTDVDAFLAEVRTRYDTLPALEMSARVYGAEYRYLYSGSGQLRSELSSEDPTAEPSVSIITNGREFFSNGRTDDGRTIWEELGPHGRVAAEVLDLGIGRRCAAGWDVRGVDLIMDRPAYHLACGYREFWVDRDWLLVVRSQDTNPLSYESEVAEVLGVKFVQPPPESFELPDDAVYCADIGLGGRCIGSSYRPLRIGTPAPD